MTPKQILDSFSETLMQDERILSPQERALLRSLIHHARSASVDSEIHEAVNATIAAAVGDTVAQRAFAVLGSSIVERIVGSAGAVSNAGIFAGLHGESSTPGRPQPSPQPPSPRPKPDDFPIPPAPSPGPPATSAIKRSMPGATSVLERRAVATAQCVVLDEFLSPPELQELVRFTFEHEADFCTSEVVALDSSEGVVNEQHRRSRVFMDLGKHRDVIFAHIQSALPLVLSKLGMEEFPIASLESQITASNDGDFFRGHRDDGDPTTATRELTFVYFFHREPREFSGGELRIHDSRSQGDWQVATGTYQTIVPQQNQIVFFPCGALHEITPVKCPSKLFADSRFTLNGWLRR